MNSVYDDEDNAPMNDEMFDRIDKNGHNPTIYTSYAEMKAAENEAMDLPFDDPPDGCWNCRNYNYEREACTLNWNNMDESYYNPDTDDREFTDFCDEWDEDKDAVWEDWVDGKDS